MRIRIYVEGPTEREALPKLLAHLEVARRRVDILPLKGSRFLKQIGRRSALILTKERDAHVFACPDLAPKDAYENTSWAYDHYEALQEVLRREAKKALRARLNPKQVSQAMARFHAHPFRHDFEVVLLACPDLLKRRLGTKADITKRYKKSPEDQNFDEYPKKIVRRLFETFARRRYDAVDDCPRVLEYARAEHVQRIAKTCPRFGEFIAALEALA